MSLFVRQFSFRIYDFNAIIGNHSTADICGAVRAKNLEQAVSVISSEVADQLEEHHCSLAVIWYPKRLSPVRLIANFNRVGNPPSYTWELAVSEGQSNPRELRSHLTLAERMSTALRTPS